MNIALLLKIVFQRKSWIIATAFIAGLAALWILVNAEPLYVSGAKLWIRESAENSSLLRIERTGAASDTHIQVQEQVIRSNRVMDGALQRGDLGKPVKSRSMLSKYRPPKQDPVAPDHLDALKALAGSVNVSIVNPEVLIVSATMNDPELAQRAVQSVIDEFQEVSLEIAVDAINRHQQYLEEQRVEREAKLREQQEALIAFEERHPELSSTAGNLAPGDSIGPVGSGGGIQSPTFAKSTTDVGPVPLISRQLAELELKRNRLAATLDPQSYELKKLNQEIEQGKALLDTYLASLAQQGKMQLEYETMNWELEQRRKSYAELLKEIQPKRHHRTRSAELRSGKNPSEEKGHADGGAGARHHGRRRTRPARALARPAHPLRRGAGNHLEGPGARRLAVPQTQPGRTQGGENCGEGGAGMSLFKHSAGLGAAKLLEKLLAFAVILAASRLYGSGGVGEFFYYFSLACLFLPLLDMGFPKVLMQDWFKSDGDERRDLLGQMILCRLALAAAACGIALAVDFVVRGAEAQPLAVIAAVAALVFENLAILIRTPDQAKNGWRYEALAPLGARVLTLALLFVLAGTLTRGWQIAVLYAIANAASILFSLPALRGAWPRFSKPRDWDKLVRRGLPFSLTGIFVMISLHIDSVMLARFSLDEVGLYNAGYRVVLVGIALTGGACHALFPRVVRLREAGESAEAAAMVGRLLRVFLLLSLAGAAGGMLVAGDLMTMLYGPEFTAAGLPFAILCLLLPLGASNNILGHALEASGDQKAAMWITLRSACFNVGANLMLIPILGMVGAAITTVLTECASLLQITWRLRHSREPAARFGDLWRVVPFGLGIALCFALLIPLPFAAQLGLGTVIVVVLLGAFHRFWFAGLLEETRETT